MKGDLCRDEEFLGPSSQSSECETSKLLKRRQCARVHDGERCQATLWCWFVRAPKRWPDEQWIVGLLEHPATPRPTELVSLALSGESVDFSKKIIHKAKKNIKTREARQKEKAQTQIAIKTVIFPSRRTLTKNRQDGNSERRMDRLHKEKHKRDCRTNEGSVLDRNTKKDGMEIGDETCIST